MKGGGLKGGKGGGFVLVCSPKLELLSEQVGRRMSRHGVESSRKVALGT